MVVPRYCGRGAEKASVQQYIGECQNNIANCSKGRMYSETARVPGINKYVAKYEK